jgi:hypothetical protein
MDVQSSGSLRDDFSELFYASKRIRREHLQTTRSCFDTVFLLPTSSLENTAQATIALSGEKRGPEVLPAPLDR